MSWGGIPAVSSGGSGYNSTATMWSNWIDMTTTASTTNTIWATWNGTAGTVTSSIGANTTTIWVAWAGQQAQLSSYQQASYPVGVNPVRRTRAEQTRIDREEAERAAERLERQIAERAKLTAKMDAAEERAHGLLVEHLTVLQRATLKKHGWFIVQGGKTKKRYVIHAQGIAGNIFELDRNNKASLRYCCHANDNLMPASDHWLSQKLWIEWCEEEFIKTANKTSGVFNTAEQYREAA